VALNWLTNRHDGTVFAIPGASNTQQAVSNAQSMKLQLTGEEVETLNQASAELQK
jgi:diketogulonate reductase-like aldo/keto reductase